MLDDLAKEVKAQLYERVKSPLFGAFALSWIPWNYRPLLATLSGITFQEKLSYFDSFYQTTWHWLAYCVAGPFITAVLFLLLYPHPARWIYSYWANQHKELKKVQQQIEDETPLTQDEAQALRRATLDKDREHEALRRELLSSINELEERIQLLQQEAGKRSISSVIEVKERDAKNPPTSSSAIKEAAKKRAVSIWRERMGNAFISLPDASKTVLEGYFHNGLKIELDVFLSLIAIGGSASESKLQEITDFHPIDITGALRYLDDRRLVNSGSGYCEISELGKNIAREAKLTTLLPRLD